MQRLDGKLFFSASDLMCFMGCAHATTLDLARLNGQGPDPRADSADAALLQRQGDAHEAAHLARLKAQGLTVVEIPRVRLAEDAAATALALAQGPDVVFQGALLGAGWGGWSDFLMRVDQPSALGDFSYEVTDTKLKRRPHPKHVLQLVLYSDLLAQIQGTMPEFAHVELGNGERASLRLDDYAHYARAARDRLVGFAEVPDPTRPIPCADCSLCRWADHCGQVWKGEDSLFNVANIARGQVKKLEAAGIPTLAGLAEHQGSVRGLASATLDKLKTQAALQQARKSGDPAFRLRPPEPGRGFDLLPEPQAGDVFYDIEGDPHYEGGLEYLHGIWADGRFHAFWAHDHTAEARALSNLLDLFRARLTAFPHARIYHYAPYEITALRRLTAKYGIGEAFLDRLLRERRFVDLYSVVRGGLICSEDNYSIKSLEVFYGLTRQGEVKTAGGSVVAYEDWRQSGDAAVLEEIRAYNEVDCRSTEMLRDWLVGIRPAAPWPILGTSAEDKQLIEDAATQDLRQRLAAASLDGARQALLFNLAQFHRREAKPGWWSIFDSLGREEEELIDDLDAMAGLVALGPAVPEKRSMARTYAFPPQEVKFRAGHGATVPTPDGFQKVEILDLDRLARRITLKIGKAKEPVLRDRLTLHPEPPIGTEVLEQAIRDVIEDQCGPRTLRAIDDVLSHRAPRLGAAVQDILGDRDPVAGTILAVHRMEETVLPIQGPPGTGKTHVIARAILSLVRAGKRVGVASNSHHAIMNVLMGCVAALEDEDLPFSVEMIHKTPEPDAYPAGAGVLRTGQNEVAAEGRHVVGGTAYFFARPENVQAFDYLFVDEAGQVGLANLVAMGRAARNIVLVGDPRQLPQVIQGVHPPPANLSCLDWMLGDHVTIPPDRGIFLNVTRRMHPAVNRFISDQVYEGRLTCHPDTTRQAMQATPFPEAGAFFLPIAHEGNAQVAPEEVSAIATAAQRLMMGTWTDSLGTTSPVQPQDIIVVAPYNAQVNALREALPETIRVGTVDKFQGQEAPVCLVSMTASSAEEMPRGMEFLLSLNRINVAVSRARALALVFASPRLREAKCETVEQMRLVNTLCALPELTGA